MVPRRESLERRLEQARRKKDSAKVAELEAELLVPAFPDEMVYLWRIYHRLRRRIAVGFAGPNPIGWQDIDAFVRLTGFRLKPWEVEAIEAIDDALLNPGPPSAAPAATATDMVPASDTRAVRSLLSSIGKRRSKKKGG